MLVLRMLVLLLLMLLLMPVRFRFLHRTVSPVRILYPLTCSRLPAASDATMTNIWSLPGAASGLLLVISTCAYVKVSAARNQPPCPTHDACRACCAAGTAS